MDDNSVPNSGAGTYKDFTLLLNNSDINTGMVFTNVGNNVYRCTRAYTANSFPNIAIRKYAGLNSVKSFKVTGFQLEVGSTVTNYQRRITQHEVYESGIANRDYLWFDGTDDFFSANSLASIVHGNDTPFTVLYAVMPKIPFSTTVGSIWSFGDTAGTNWNQYQYFSTFNNKIGAYRRPNSGSAAITASTNFTATPQIGSFVFAGQTAKMHTNAIELASGAYNTVTMGTNSNRFSIGAQGTSITTEFLKGNYYALAIFNKALSDSDRQYVESLLSEQFTVASISQPENTNPNLLTAWVRDYDISSGENANLNDVNLSLLEDII
jgi:hypothetical protein